jgi:ADP-ribosyl-[dinitrogen reductase] hydrolase
MGLMTKDQVIGMVVGCAVGDALGAPYEFLYPEDVRFTADSPMIAGGMHDVSVGEWTDDTALMLATADAYVSMGGFDPCVVADNFKAWRDTGKFGTRDYVFDIGGTTDAAIERLTPDTPYGGSSSFGASGNGSLMRIAPAIAANHDNKGAAIGEAVALALMTHGNADTVRYISAFVDELFGGKMWHNNNLRKWDITTTHGTGSIMHSFNVAARAYTATRGRENKFACAMQYAIQLGYDTDTNAAITGMLVGRWLGYSAIPKRWLDTLQQHDHIYSTAEKLYEIGKLKDGEYE